MGEMGVPGHLDWIIFVIAVVVVGIPFGRILQRTGHSMWWVIAFFIPGVSIVALWVLAFARWPTVDRS